MYIYLDVIWLLNFCFDALLLLLTAIILKRKVNKWRILVSSFIGSLLVLLMVSPFAEYSSHPFVKFLFSLAIIGVAFGYKRFRFFIQGLLTFYFTTFMLGGGMIGVHYFFEFEMAFLDGTLVTNSSSFGNPISWGFVMIGFPIVWYFSKNRLNDIETKKIFYDQIVKVMIEIEDVTLNVKGLVDNGNQLLDPITRSPVMILDVNKYENFFPKMVIEQSKNIELITDNLSDTTHNWENRLRLIPYRGVGQEHQFLLAIKPDRITIYQERETVEVKKALLALNHTILSTDDEYDCIIHPNMIISSSAKPAS
ncbi:sigma-E processing peptidase SpoIIGA [Fredinandcohnia quinoae]|uniref:Sporulation sigma-E factor-processing peptidase n=1 Tax=Fredinandcohnia quinoae TaxID=2918902 RepID=A0AAW5DT91_9BACI|nr:sigma-E processing peptidase SpoIIGA [Fredinandcohnia sp. SECRCQ15]MCH1623866.1 sigma-E processing peptidase SpoIIGA [Fredinandcohnia sp. SECRCQ15]